MKRKPYQASRAPFRGSAVFARLPRAGSGGACRDVASVLPLLVPVAASRRPKGTAGAVRAGPSGLNARLAYFACRDGRSAGPTMESTLARIEKPVDQRLQNVRFDVCPHDPASAFGLEAEDTRPPATRGYRKKVNAGSMERSA